MFLEICAPEGINALRVVADDHDIGMRGAQQAHDFALQFVRILVFVHHNVRILPRERFADAGKLLQQRNHMEEQVVVIHQVVLHFVCIELLLQLVR